MTEFRISLPDETANYVNTLVAEGKFTSPSDVIADALVRTQAARARLTELIRESIDSPGNDIEFSDDWWESRMDALQAEAERRQSA